MTDGAAVSRVQIRLRTSAWELQAEVSVPERPAPVSVWLPFLRALADTAATRAEDHAHSIGRSISCRKGCASCCRQLVTLSLVEARAIAALVEAMPEPRRSEIRARFEDAMARASASGVLDRDYDDPSLADPTSLATTAVERLAHAWFKLGIPCPFLEDETCSIHPVRPLVCRQYLVTSPREACADVYATPVQRAPIVQPASQRLATAFERLTGARKVVIPLPMALALPPPVAEAVDQAFDPLETLEAILGEFGEWLIEPLDDDGEAHAA